MQGLVATIPFIYGSTAIPISPAEAGKMGDESHTHRWSVYVRGVKEEDDLSGVIKKVVFKLHESFLSPSRSFDVPPYEVVETGWGEFEIMIKIFFRDPAEKPVTVYHQLQLYPKDDLAGKTKQTVVINNYDELIFQEPTEAFAPIVGSLAETASLPPTHNGSNATALGSSGVATYQQYSMQTEQIELQRLDEAHQRVSEEYLKCKTQLDLMQSQLKQTQSEIRQLEG